MVIKYKQQKGKEMKEYLKKFLSNSVKSDIEEQFQTEYLYNKDISLIEVIEEYLNKHLEELYLLVSDGIPEENLISKSECYDICWEELLKIDEDDLIESVSTPYHGLSDYERNK